MKHIQWHAVSCNEHAVFCEPCVHSLCIMPGVEIYTWHGYFDDFTVNVNRKCECHCIIVINIGCLT